MLCFVASPIVERGVVNFFEVELSCKTIQGLRSVAF